MANTYVRGERDAHRVEDVFAFTDIDGLLKCEHKLHHEL
jgi:hypothetical protein